MKVLYIVQSGQCRHDYGVDWLYFGLCSVLGYENVLDWPEKDVLHLKGPRDECQIDSDQWRERKHHSLRDACQSADLAILTCATEDSADVCRSIPSSTPIVAVDMTDQVRDLREQYTLTAGRTLSAYFKREIPLGYQWGLPLPLTYPIVEDLDWQRKRNSICYHATSHGNAGPGIPRIRIVNALRKDAPEHQLDVELYVGQAKGTRPSPDEYHERLRKALVGISWNGHPYCENWDSNRVWENFAYGMAQVLERPRIKIPNTPRDNLHCVYADTSEQVARKAIQLLNEPQRAREIAEAGNRFFIEHHSAPARARYLLENVGAVGRKAA